MSETQAADLLAAVQSIEIVLTICLPLITGGLLGFVLMWMFETTKRKPE